MRTGTMKWLAWAGLGIVLITPVALMAWLQREMQAAPSGPAWIQANFAIMVVWAYSALMAGGVLLAAVLFGVIRLVRGLAPGGGNLGARVRGVVVSVAVLLPAGLALGLGSNDVTAPGCVIAGTPLAADVAGIPFLQQLPPPAEGCDLGEIWDTCGECGIGSMKNVVACFQCMAELLECGGADTPGCVEACEAAGGTNCHYECNYN